MIGERLGPRGDESLPWSELEGMDSVYFTAGDGGAARAARTGRTLVATVRAKGALNHSATQVDLLVASAGDAGESYASGDLRPAPLLVAKTEGANGGSLVADDGTVTRWAPAPLPGPAVDAYGAGDSFAAGLTYGLGAELGDAEALALGARCGAACMTGRGPYEGQLDPV